MAWNLGAEPGAGARAQLRLQVAVLCSRQQRFGARLARRLASRRVTTFSTGTPLGLTCGISGLASGVGGNVMCNSLGKVAVKKGVTIDPQFGPTPTWFD